MQLSQDYLQPTCNHRFEPGLIATNRKSSQTVGKTVFLKNALIYKHALFKFQPLVYLQL